MSKNATGYEAACSFHDTHYEVIGAWILEPGKKITLGKQDNQVCRFCGQGCPGVTFKKKAHAIPESLGNKSLYTTYECDACNQMFGQGIENDFGNWSKPMRNFAGTRGKRSVPTIKMESAGGSQGGFEPMEIAIQLAALRTEQADLPHSALQWGSCLSHTEHPGNRAQQVILRKRHDFRPAARGAFSGPPSLLTPRRPRALKGRGSFTWACDAAGFSGHCSGNRLGHSRGPSPFGHRSSPEAPSLHRHYPVSPVLRASPPPSPAQPDPRGLVSWHVPRHRPGLPVLRPFPSSMRAAATTPAEPVGACVAHFPTGVSLPRYQGGSASASYPFRGLLGVYSRCGPHGR